MRRLMMMSAMLIAMTGCGAGEPDEDISLQSQEAALACSPDGSTSYGQCRGTEGNRYCFASGGVASACNYQPCETAEECRGTCVGGTALCQ